MCIYIFAHVLHIPVQYIWIKFSRKEISTSIFIRLSCKISLLVVAAFAFMRPNVIAAFAFVQPNEVAAFSRFHDNLYRIFDHMFHVHCSLNINVTPNLVRAYTTKKRDCLFGALNDLL
jgi:hypothetical protein